MTTQGFPGGSVVKSLPANVGDVGSVPLSGKIPWRRKGQPTPVFLPGEFHGQRSLAGCSLWGSKRVDHDLATKQEKFSFHCQCHWRHHLWCCQRVVSFRCSSKCSASTVKSLYSSYWVGLWLGSFYGMRNWVCTVQTTVTERLTNDPCHSARKWKSKDSCSGNHMTTLWTSYHAACSFGDCLPV